MVEVGVAVVPGGGSRRRRWFSATAAVEVTCSLEKKNGRRIRRTVAGEEEWWPEFFAGEEEDGRSLPSGQSASTPFFLCFVEKDMDTGNFRLMLQDIVKLDSFDSTNYTRWAEKVKFLLLVMNVFHVMDENLEPIPDNPVPKAGKTIDP
ncbi:hypothetical protein OSB04_031624 [Centaurea solstitialis]|uniref:Uncharacterized protein n=1 Tax=Centaurea solstitialis TaxID=347529 RepID=A0AA38SN01_9ASTR|nr:hypothetical protein OSB04_031624 [Centaurea solstitialis]